MEEVGLSEKVVLVLLAVEAGAVKAGVIKAGSGSCYQGWLSPRWILGRAVKASAGS